MKIKHPKKPINKIGNTLHKKGKNGQTPCHTAWYINRYHWRRVFATYCHEKWRCVGSERNVALPVRYACLIYYFHLVSFQPAGTRHREVLRKFDHAAIYLHIAGSYSPIMLVSLREAGYWGWGIFSFVWLCAFIGTTLCFCRLKEHSYLETICYIAMGCSIFVAFKPLCNHVPSFLSIGSLPKVSHTSPAPYFTPSTNYPICILFSTSLY